MSEVPLYGERAARVASRGRQMREPLPGEMGTPFRFELCLGRNLALTGLSLKWPVGSYALP